LILPHGVAFGKKDNSDKNMLAEAKKLSYEGQIAFAEQLIGKQEEELAKSKKEAPGDSMNSMMLAMVWGAIGTGYFIYGKKQARAAFLICGIALCVFPMLISDILPSIILGLIFSIAPFKIEI
jgi:hypothetical protein